MKNFILDSNVIIHDPDCIFEFDDNKVIILFEVLEDLDRYKSSPHDVGNNVRKAIRTLDDLRAKGHLNKGVKLESGGMVAVMSGKEHHAIKDKHNTDGILLSTALTLGEHNDNPVVLVTKNVNLRVKADAFEVQAVDYEKDKGLYDYTGHDIADITVEQRESLEENGYFYIDPPPPTKNEYFRFVCEGENVPILGRHTTDGLIERIDSKITAMRVEPRNTEQCYAMDALMNDDIKFVTLQAKAGAGKTLLAICAALQKVKDKKYKKILIARPVISVGRDIGALPGDIDEKMAPWMKPIMDNIGVIANGGGQREADLTKYLEISPITYIRGRSLSNAFIIIDEAQNLTPREIKTIATRVGEGSKIVFTGDVSQIDLPTLDASSSGFTYMINKFNDQELHAHVQLSKSERSEAAEMAADLL
jgi:PhoH-like ATPase